MNLSQAIKEAKISAPLVTIYPVKGGHDIVVHFIWNGTYSPESYFTDCPRDALQMAYNMNCDKLKNRI